MITWVAEALENGPQQPVCIKALRAAMQAERLGRQSACLAGGRPMTKTFSVEHRRITTPRRAKPPRPPKPQKARPPRRPPVWGAPRVRSGSWDYNSPPETEDEPS